VWEEAAVRLLHHSPLELDAIAGRIVAELRPLHDSGRAMAKVSIKNFIQRARRPARPPSWG